MDYNYDPDRVKSIDDSIKGEPPDGYHICDGIIDYYFDAKEHCFYYLDENGNKCYTSAGFIFLGGDFSEVVSCSICSACTNEERIVNKDSHGVSMERKCKVFTNPTQEIIKLFEGEKFICNKFSPDKHRKNYNLVLKLINKSKKD